MNVNGTFFVQMANFYLFYWLLRLFLFKPAVKIISHENSSLLMLVDNNDQYKKSIDIKLNDRQKYLLSYHEYFKTHQPTCSFNAIKNTFLDNELSHTTSSPSLSDEDITELIETITQECGEKIKHVH